MHPLDDDARSRADEVMAAAQMNAFEPGSGKPYEDAAAQAEARRSQYAAGSPKRHRDGTPKGQPSIVNVTCSGSNGPSNDPFREKKRQAEVSSRCSAIEVNGEGWRPTVALAGHIVVPPLPV
jgi:hypothetical protein